MARIPFFESKIRPVLVEHCYACHSAQAIEKGKLRGGLRLDTREASRKGGESGPAVVPGGPVQVYAPGFRNAYDVWVTADGNGLTEDHVVRSHSVNGVTSAVLNDGVGNYGWPSDFVEIGGVLWGSDVAKDQLYTFDATTGLVTPVGAPYDPQWDSIQALAYDADQD